MEALREKYDKPRKLAGLTAIFVLLINGGYFYALWRYHRDFADVNGVNYWSGVSASTQEALFYVLPAVLFLSLLMQHLIISKRLVRTVTVYALVPLLLTGLCIGAAYSIRQEYERNTRDAELGQACFNAVDTENSCTFLKNAHYVLMVFLLIDACLMLWAFALCFFARRAALDYAHASKTRKEVGMFDV